MEQGLIILPKTKAFKARVIPLSRASRLAMSRYLLVRQSHRSASRAELWLSTTRPVGLRADSITAAVASRAREAGVTVSAHQFRRRFAAEWSRAGGTDDSLMAIAGWSSLRLAIDGRLSGSWLLTRMVLLLLLHLQQHPCPPHADGGGGGGGGCMPGGGGGGSPSRDLNPSSCLSAHNKSFIEDSNRTCPPIATSTSRRYTRRRAVRLARSARNPSLRTIGRRLMALPGPIQ